MEFIDPNEYNFELNDSYLTSEFTDRMSIECNPDDSKLDTDSDTETNTNNPMELDDFDEITEELFKSDNLIRYEYDGTLDITNKLSNINLDSNNNSTNQMKTY